MKVVVVVVVVVVAGVVIVVVPGVGCGLGLVTGGAWPGFIAAVSHLPEHSERRQKMGILVQEDFIHPTGFVTGVWAAVGNSIELLLLTSHSP